MISEAVWPSSTKLLVPVRVKSLPEPLAARVMPGLVPLAGGLGEGDGGDGLAAGDAREVGGLGGVVAGVEQGVGGEHDRGEVRGAQQGAAHLLEHDAELDEAVARAAELLGDGEALQAHLLAHLRPHGLVVTGLGLHLLADGGFGRLALEEAAHGLAELFLLLGEGEVHAPSLAIAPSTRRRIGLCTCVYTEG